MIKIKQLCVHLYCHLLKGTQHNSSTFSGIVCCLSVLLLAKMLQINNFYRLNFICLK